MLLKLLKRLTIKNLGFCMTIDSTEKNRTQCFRTLITIVLGTSKNLFRGSDCKYLKKCSIISKNNRISFFQVLKLVTTARISGMSLKQNHPRAHPSVILIRIPVACLARDPNYLHKHIASEMETPSIFGVSLQLQVSSSCTQIFEVNACETLKLVNFRSGIRLPSFSQQNPEPMPSQERPGQSKTTQAISTSLPIPSALSATNLFVLCVTLRIRDVVGSSARNNKETTSINLQQTEDDNNTCLN